MCRYSCRLIQVVGKPVTVLEEMDPLHRIAGRNIAVLLRYAR